MTRGCTYPDCGSAAVDPHGVLKASIGSPQGPLQLPPEGFGGSRGLIRSRRWFLADYGSLPQAAIVASVYAGMPEMEAKVREAVLAHQKGEVVMDAALDAARILEQVILVRRSEKPSSSSSAQAGAGEAGTRGV